MLYHLTKFDVGMHYFNEDKLDLILSRDLVFIHG